MVDFVGPAAAGLKALVEGAYAADKVVAADCHGPMGLLEATKPDGTPLVAGLKVTAFTNAEEAAVGATEWVTSNSVLMETKFVVTPDEVEAKEVLDLLVQERDQRFVGDWLRCHNRAPIVASSIPRTRFLLRRSEGNTCADRRPPRDAPC